MKKIEPGDRVSFLHENMQGVVIRMIDSDEVEVFVEGYGNIPVNLDELVVMEIKQKPKANSIEQKVALSVHGFQLSLSKLKEGSFRHHLFNGNNASAIYNVYLWRKNKFSFVRSGILDAFACQFIMDYNYPNEIDLPHFGIQIISSPTECMLFPTLIQCEVKIKNKHLLQTPIFIPELDSEAYLFKIENGLASTTQEEEVEERSIPSKSERPNDVVDLHLEKIAKIKDLHSNEYLQYQLDYFEKVLNAAIMHEMPKITFIHGVGSGILQAKIIKILKTYPQVKKHKLETQGPMAYAATIVSFVY